MDASIVQSLWSFVNGTFILEFFTVFIGEYLPFIVAALFLFLVIFRIKKWKQKVFFLLFSVLTLILSKGIILETIQHFYFRERPFKILDIQPLIDISGAALPSAHATIFFSLAFLTFFINQKWGWWFTFLAFFISVGRVTAGIHWPSDILGGILTAGVGTVLAYLILKESWSSINVSEPVQ